MPKSASNVFVVFPILSWGFYVHLSLTFGKLSRTPKRTHEDHAVMKCVILTIFVYSFQSFSCLLEKWVAKSESSMEKKSVFWLAVVIS